MNNKYLNKSGADARMRSLPGIIILISATLVVFIVMMFAMYKVGMLTIPEFITEWLGNEDDNKENEFMNDFIDAVRSEPHTVEFERVSIGEDELKAIIAGVDMPAGTHTYTINTSYNNFVSTRRSTIYIGENIWTVDLSQHNSSGAFIPYRRVSYTGNAVELTETAQTGEVNSTLAAHFNASDSFAPQPEAGITYVSEILKAIENGADIVYTAELVRSDSVNKNNYISITFEYPDGITNYMKIDVETGVMTQEISTINGVPYYQALLDQ